MVFYLRIYCISIPPKNDLEDLETMVDVIQKQISIHWEGSQGAVKFLKF
jgi:hypothetical protein